jgi:hypothetical protein
VAAEQVEQAEKVGVPGLSRVVGTASASRELVTAFLSLSDAPAVQRMLLQHKRRLLGAVEAWNEWSLGKGGLSYGEEPCWWWEHLAHSDHRHGKVVLVAESPEALFGEEAKRRDADAARLALSIIRSQTLGNTVNVTALLREELPSDEALRDLWELVEASLDPELTSMWRHRSLFILKPALSDGPA